MSFGKAFSWDKRIVDKAVKYAQRKDVLLVHAAGNSATALDGTNNFPNPIFAEPALFSRASATNWIEVGAITYHQDERLVASFSNYSKDQVDLFAPGYQINSTLPDNQYGKYNGTSMAAPMVTGVAAMLRSYFPDLSAHEVKEIIMQSATPIVKRVKRPSDQALVDFATLSKTGAILNAADAIALALSKD
jgi:subtilisin family serine protease